MRNNTPSFHLLIALALSSLTLSVHGQSNSSERTELPTLRGEFPVNPVQRSHRSSNTVLEEDFQDLIPPSLPSGWTSNSPEGDFKTGDADDANANGSFPVPDIPGNIFAMANDDVCNCDMSNIRLVSPSFDLSGLSDMVLRFNAYHDMNWGGGDAHVDVSPDGGSSWNQELTLNASTNWQYYVLDLSTYTGNSNVQIRFRWSDGGTWASGFAVDNVVVDQMLDNDLRVEKVRTTEMKKDLEYTELPLEQGKDMTIGARVMNNGRNMQTNTRVAVSIERNGQILHQDTSAAYDLDSAERRMFWIPTNYDPDSTGLYKVHTEALADQSEEYPADNEMSDSVRYDCDRFARDRGMYEGHGLENGSYSNGERKGFRSGNLFGMNKNSDIQAVELLLDSSSQAGSSLYGELYRLDTVNDEFVKLAETSLHTVQSGDISSPGNETWLELAFDNTIAVDSGNYYLATAALPDSSSDALAIGSSGISPHETSYMHDDSSGTWKDVNSTPMVAILAESFSTELPDDTTICSDSTLTLDAGPGDQYDWSTGEQSRTIDVQDPGDYWVSVTQGICQSSDTVSVDTTENCANSIQEHERVQAVRLSPNPTSNRLRIGSEQEIRIRQLEVIDMKGRTVLRKEGRDKELDVRDLKPGIYQLRVHTENGPRTGRFVKKQ